MNKQRLNELMAKIDKTKKPKHWIKFINDNTKEHNIILKFGKRAFCTHCQKYFDKDVTIHSYEQTKCPYCNYEYYVRNNNKRNITFLRDFAFYAKIDNNIVLRVFEVKSEFDFSKKKFVKSVKEYARFIPQIGLVINNAVSFYMWNVKVYHNIKKIKWHKYTGQGLMYKKTIYPYNETNLFKNTVYEYAPIKELKKEFKYYDYLKILQIAGYRSFELLWKLGLHRLSLSAKYFNKTGNFQKRFGVPRSFLGFMIENDLNYEQYRILKLLQEPNIELIKNYQRYSYNYLAFMKKQGYLKDKDIVNKYSCDEKKLREICRYVPLRKFLAYKKGVKNIDIYIDYLAMLKKLNYNMKSRKELFPKQLIATHNKISKKIKVIENKETEVAIGLRFLELSKYIYKNDKYIIFPAPNVETIKDEGEQQGNCVARLYLQPYKDKETEIYFIRELEDITKSFITLEFKDGRIRQKELAHSNIAFTKEQLGFMENWVNFRKFVDKREEYKRKNKNKKTKIVNYDLTKMVA